MQDHNIVLRIPGQNCGLKLSYVKLLTYASSGRIPKNMRQRAEDE